MLFVKVRKNLVVNANQIARIDFDAEGNNAMLTFSMHGATTVIGSAEISRDAADFLLSLLEVSQAFDFDYKPEAYTATLKSRLAQTLRDTQPYGATVAQLAALTNETEDATRAALSELVVENVVKTAPGEVGHTAGAPHDQGNQLWFHASHAPKPTHVCHVCGFTLANVTEQEALENFGWFKRDDKMECNSCVQGTCDICRNCNHLRNMHKDNWHGSESACGVCDDCPIFGGLKPSRDLSA